MGNGLGLWGSSDGSREIAYSVVVSQVGGSIPGLGKRLKGRNVDRLELESKRIAGELDKRRAGKDDREGSR